MSRAIVAIFALAIVASVGVMGFEAALEDAGEQNTIQKEAWTPDPGNVTELEESNRKGAYYDHSVTVWDSNGNEMEEGVDYEWYVGNGTVKAIEGGGLDGETSAEITYGFEQTTQTQRDFAALAGVIPQGIGVAFPAFLFVLFLLLFRG